MKLALFVYKNGEVYVHEDGEYYEPIFHAYTSESDFNDKLKKLIDEMVKIAPR